MAQDLLMVHKDSGAPSLDEAASQLQMPVENLDSSFGVQPIDPRSGDYAVMTKEGVSPDEASSGTRFSNPRIDTFGPPR
jgi:hypothetical protein